MISVEVMAMTIHKIDERRSHSRVKMENKVLYNLINDYVSENSAGKKDAEIHDISLKGISVILPEKPEPGDVIEVEIMMGNQENTKTVLFCEVANVRWVENLKAYITGLDFMILKENDREIIETFIIEHRKTFI
jgi:c-di-GMP-binding flagellar brake protein YcgR